MKNDKSLFFTLLKMATITGNCIFFLWIVYNAIDENFQGTLPEKFSFFFLTALLIINSFFVLQTKHKSSN